MSSKTRRSWPGSNSAASGASATVNSAGFVYFQYSSRAVGKPMARSRVRAVWRASLAQLAPCGNSSAAIRASVKSMRACAKAITQPPPTDPRSRFSQLPRPILARPF